MTAFQQKNDEETRKTVAREALKAPCASCGDKAEMVYSYRPENPEKFGCPPGYGLYVPLCLKCWNDGKIDLDFLEAQLEHCGKGLDAAAVLDGEIQRRDS